MGHLAVSQTATVQAQAFYMHALPLLLSTLFFGMVPMAQDSDVGGSFESEFEVVADNCEGKGLTLDKSEVVVAESGKRLTVKISDLPTLVGRTGRKGKLRAEIDAPAKAAGLKARYGLNARISGDKLQGVFVAEYFRTEKPLCTKSFSISGTRSKR